MYVHSILQLPFTGLSLAVVQVQIKPWTVLWPKSSFPILFFTPSNKKNSLLEVHDPSWAVEEMLTVREEREKAEPCKQPDKSGLYMIMVP